jgi:hypothetical protein
MGLQTQIPLTSSEELEKFYSESFYFSYSSIKKLLYSPRAFYSHYILRQKEDSTDTHLIAGRAAHCLLLEPDKFDEQFIMLPGKIPTESNKVIIDHVFNNHYLSMNNSTLDLVDFSQEILNQLLTNNLYQNLADDKKPCKDHTMYTGDEKRLAKILTDNNKEYFTFLKEKESKTVIDSTVKAKAEETVACLKANSNVCALMALGHDNSKGVTVYSELALLTETDDFDFGFKGIIDNVVVDENIKTIFINDLKLTNKPIQDFPSAVDYYRYDIQASMYLGLAYEKFIKDRPDAEEWNIIFTFIVADKYNQVYPFQVSNETVTRWKDEFKLVINTLDYHYKNRDYTLPYELAIGNIKL